MIITIHTIFPMLIINGNINNNNDIKKEISGGKIQLMNDKKLPIKFIF